MCLGLHHLPCIIEFADLIISLEPLLVRPAVYLTVLVGGCADPTAHYALLMLSIPNYLAFPSLRDRGQELISLLKTRKCKMLVWLIAALFYFQLSLDGNKLEGYSRVFCKVGHEPEVDCLVDMHKMPPQSAKDCRLNGSDFCGVLCHHSLNIYI